MSVSIASRPALLERLRRQVARLEGAAQARVGAPVPIASGIDGALPGGGLARAAIHEILASDPGVCGAFCGLVLGRAGGHACWIEEQPEPYPPGLVAFGLDPARLIVVRAGRSDLLWATEECLRCNALAAVVAVLPAFDLAAGRRLQLAAEAGGTLGLLVRPDHDPLLPSAARTRWRISPLPGAAEPAHLVPAPHWRIELLRVRGGHPGCWDVVWNTDDKTLILKEKYAAAHG